MFFSASISVKLRELAKMRTSTRLMRRCKKVTEASTVKPWEGSMFSSSCWWMKIRTRIRMCVLIFLFLPILICVQKSLQAADGTKTPTEGIMTLTVEEVAAESRGKMPPQAMMRLSTTWEMRCMLLWTNTTFSLLFTKSRMVFVEWLKSVKNKGKGRYNVFYDV